MSWIFLAIIGHVANGVAFVIDKALLSSAFKRSATYAGLVGILSILVVLAIPWMNQWPAGSALLLSLTSGILFVFALWGFFAALARAEASRIVPIVGSLIPVLTLAETAFALHERLTASQLVGFGLLVVATAILSSSGGTSRPSRAAIGFAVTSAVLFSFAAVTGKAAYDAAGFLPAFVVSRLAAVAVSIVVVTLLDPMAGTELRGMLKTKGQTRSRSSAGLLALFGQSLGAIGFLFVQLATAQGSAAIVSALQAVQYGLLVLAAFALRRRAPKLLGEELTPRIIWIKLFALALTAGGLALVI
jgi:uncharacterized membrane protein